MVHHVLVIVVCMHSLNYTKTIYAVVPPLAKQHYLRIMLDSLRLGSTVLHLVLLAKYTYTIYLRVQVC